MFDEGQRLDHPYHRTKFEAERIVRDASTGPGGCTGPASSSATPARARWTRSTARTTCSRRSRGCARAAEWFPLVGSSSGHEPRAGRLRGRRPGPHRPRRGSTARPSTSSTRSRSAGRRPERLRPRRRAAARGARRQGHSGLPRGPALRDEAAGAARDAASLLADVGIPEQIVDHLALEPIFDARDAQRALAAAASACRRSTPTRGGCGPLRGPPGPRPAPRLVGPRRRAAVRGRHRRFEQDRARGGAQVARHGGVPLLVARNGTRLAALSDEIEADGGRPGSTRATSQTWTPSTRRWPVLADHAASTCSSTTPAARSGARWPCPRPLPRLRAHGATELPRRRGAHPRPPAAHARAPAAATSSTFLDRRADQPAAVLGLRRLQGRARRVHPRGRLETIGDDVRSPRSTCRSCAPR